jgi:hypothetical protein
MVTTVYAGSYISTSVLSFLVRMILLLFVSILPLMIGFPKGRATVALSDPSFIGSPFAPFKITVRLSF